MAPTVTRLILSFALLVSAPVYYIVASIVLYEATDYGGEGTALIVFVTLTAIGGFALIWWLIWRDEVQWTPQRRRATWGMLMAGLVLGGALGAIISAAVGYDEDGVLLMIFGALIPIPLKPHA